MKMKESKKFNNGKKILKHLESSGVTPKEFFDCLPIITSTLICLFNDTKLERHKSVMNFYMAIVGLTNLFSKDLEEFYPLEEIKP